MGLFDKLKGKQNNRAVVIGLDGTPYTLAKRFIADGTMPSLAEIARRGSLLQMDTSIPDISSVAWTSFMTGSNPGRHGVYGFLDLQPGSYKIYFPSSKHIRAETLWGVVGQHSRRSIVINVPSTYPAQPLNGMLVAGFVAVDLNKATYPPELVRKLKEMDYRIDVDARKVQQSHDALMEDILKTLERRVETLLYLFDREKWDLFVGVITSTDRLQHFFWDAIEDETHKYHSAFKDYYRRVDNFLGAVAERLRGETMFIMSDHGFTGIDKQVYLNRWLVDNGFLKLKANARSIEDIDQGSLAFALDPGRIYVNVKGKYPNGAVDSSDSDRIVDEISRGLSEITSDGATIVKHIYKRDALFSGPCIAAAPDLCVQSVYRYDLKGAVNKTELMDREVFTGMHTQDDATLFINRPADSLKKVRPRIIDVAPSVLDAIGLTPRESMDGQSLLEH
ncbi:MAG TPA: alkaline phosphatase family protein [Blastocatellia bacterium]